MIMNSSFHNPQEAALDKTKWILKNHKPQPLEEKQVVELGKIIRTAQKVPLD